ncbi:unnamed protein product [Meganyctiphanes norvegica]|uniref:C2H2-type domain-containing protein n=1 Tax=Meganyctiphanes norvegica TaxID=48144 RepID=A0AAV2RDN9_MEGNR
MDFNIADDDIDATIMKMKEAIADDHIDATIMKMKVDYAESNHSEPDPESSEDSDDPFDVYAYVETHMMNEFSECESDTNSGGAEGDATTKGSKQRFECMECDDVFDTRDDLIKHIDGHFNSDVFSTDVAHERLKKKRENNNGRESMKRFKCKLCTYRCTNKKRLADHMAVHSDEKPFACTQCKFKTKHKVSLKSHTERKHSKKKSQSCVISDLRRTQPTLKPKVEPLLEGQIYACPELDCDFVTKNVNEYTEHMDIHDTSVSPKEESESESSEAEEEYIIARRKYKKSYMKTFKCKYSNCNYTVTKKEAFSLHLMRHKGLNPAPQKCNMCDFKCALRDGLRKHIRSHTKPFQCHLCDFRCAERSYLNQHMMKHTGEKPFACDYCDYRAVSKMLIKAHSAVHLTTKLHNCDYCTFATNRKQELFMHVERIHIKEKPYVCEYCPYATSQKRELGRHIERKHSEFRPAQQKRPQAPKLPRAPRQPRPPRQPKMESNIVNPEALLPQPGSFAPVNVPMTMPPVPPMVQMPHASFAGYQFPYNNINHGHFYGQH